MKTKFCIIIAVFLSPLADAQFDPTEGPSVISRYKNARIAAEGANAAAEGAIARAEGAHALERSRSLRLEEQRRQILWEREEAEWQQRQAEKAQALNPAPKQNGAPSAKAISEWRRAAELGNAQAQARLGCCYGDGDGVSKDFVLAYMWLNLAAASDANAVSIRNEVEKMMTPEQIAEGQKLSREWKPKRESAGGSNAEEFRQGARIEIPDRSVPSETSPPASGAEFRRGFKNGYKKADPYGVPPLPPQSEPGHRSYEDGFGVGYAQATKDAASRKAR